MHPGSMAQQRGPTDTLQEGSCWQQDMWCCRGMRDGARLHRCPPILLRSGEWDTPAPRPVPLGLLLKGTQMFAQLSAAAGSKHQTAHLKISGPFLTPLTASLPESVSTCFATRQNVAEHVWYSHYSIRCLGGLSRGKQREAAADRGQPGRQRTQGQRCPGCPGLGVAANSERRDRSAVGRSSLGQDGTRGRAPGRDPTRPKARGTGRPRSPGGPEEPSGMAEKATPGMQ